MGWAFFLHVPVLLDRPIEPASGGGHREPNCDRLRFMAESGAAALRENLRLGQRIDAARKQPEIWKDAGERRAPGIL